MKKSILLVLLSVCLILSTVPAAASETSGASEEVLTRAEAIGMIWEAAGKPEPENAETPFGDLDGSPYRVAVAWAVENGITNGVSADRFSPDAPVTRTQIAAFLYRQAGEPGRTGDGAWYGDAAQWALQNIRVFGDALPLSRKDGDEASKDELEALLCRVEADSAAPGDVYILYTSDVHCGVESGFGYAGLSAVRDALEEQGFATVLVDDGDSIQGEALGDLTKGEAIVDLMNAMRYDVAIPGNHEFEYGTDRFLELTQKAEFPYVSCNFTKEDEPVFEPYRIVEISGMKIAFVGVTTPDSIVSAAPMHFQNEAGEYIYGFCRDEDGEGVYAAVQKAVDDARAEGADYVYVMGHMGNEAKSFPWTYADVISHTEGIDVFFDGHSHDTDQVVMKNKNGQDTVRSACGTKLQGIGYSRISPDKGIAETGIWSWNGPEALPDAYGLENEIRDRIRSAKEDVNRKLGQVIAHSDFPLTINDPEAVDSSGAPIRMVRRAETNLGDLCADAYRLASGADIALSGGGSIRKSVPAGDITGNDIFNVHPFGDGLCLIRAAGQQILDALEWGASKVPDEFGGFLQVSGMSYEIDVSVPSGCQKDENGMMTGIEGERRVKNVRVGGEPLDPGKLYTVAGTDFYLLQNGDGYTAFDGAEVLLEFITEDYVVLTDTVTGALGGRIGDEYADPCGQGRITITGAAE